jgi:hypothetical protein
MSTAFKRLGEMEKRAYGASYTPSPQGAIPLPGAASALQEPQQAPSFWSNAGTAINRNKFAMLGGLAGTGMGLGIASVPIGIAGSWLGSKLDSHFNKERDNAAWRAQATEKKALNPYQSLGHLGASMIGKGMPPAPAAK